MRGAIDITSPEVTWGRTTKQIRNMMFTAEQSKAIAAIEAGEDMATVCEDWDVTPEWLAWAMS